MTSCADLRTRLLALAVLASGVAAGCSSAPHPAVVPASGPAIDTQAVLAPLARALAARATAVRTMRGRAEIMLSSAPWGGSTQTEAAILAERPGKLRLRAYAGPVTVFDLVAAEGRFWAHVPDRRELWTGSAEALERRTGLPMGGDRLVEALLGNPFGAPESPRLVSWDADRAVVGWPAPGGGEAVATLRRLDGAPLSYEWRRDGRTVASVRYDDFMRETEGLWPRKVLFRWSDPEASLRLVFHEQQLNRELPAEAFQPPAGRGASPVDLDADTSGDHP